MSYNSKYTGQQVEALLDIVSQGGGTGGEGGEVQKTTEEEILAMGFTKNKGTITEVKMNGESKGTSGVVDLGTVITSHQDISGKLDATTAASTYAKKEDMPTKVSELVNDAKYASAEDTDGVVDDVIVSGGGSNIYTLDIGEWDGESNIEDLPITMEDVVGLYNADSVRIRSLEEDGTYVYYYPSIVYKSDSDGFIGTSLALNFAGEVCFVVCGGMPEYNLTFGSLNIDSFTPYQPVFGIGVYDEDTGSWNSLSYLKEMIQGVADLDKVIESNKRVVGNLCSIGQEGAVNGLVSAPLYYMGLPFETYTATAFSISDGLVTLLVDVVKTDGTVEQWSVYINEDGTETYEKYQ